MYLRKQKSTPHLDVFMSELRDAACRVSKGLAGFNSHDSYFVGGCRWLAVIREHRLDSGRFSSAIEPIISTTVSLDNPAFMDAAEGVDSPLEPLAGRDPYFAGKDAKLEFVKATCFPQENRIADLETDWYLTLKPTALVARCLNKKKLDLSKLKLRQRTCRYFLQEVSEPVLWFTPLDADLRERLQSGDPCVDDLLQELGLLHFKIDTRSTEGTSVLPMLVHRTLLEKISYIPTIAEAQLYFAFEPSAASEKYGRTVHSRTGQAARNEIVVPTHKLAQKVAKANASQFDIVNRAETLYYEDGPLVGGVYITERTRRIRQHNPCRHSKKP